LVWLSLEILAVLALCGQALAQDTARASADQTPSLSIPNTVEFYPAKARQLGLTGRVGLECFIDMNGHAQNIAVVESSGSILDQQAIELLSIGHFDIPEDWAVTGGPEKRYLIGMTFELSNKPPVLQFQDGRTVIRVKGSLR
jgi:TonB family protein